MAGISDLKKDVLIEIDDTPFRVVGYEHAKLGRGGAIARTKLKNLRTGAVTDKTFKGSDSVDLAEVNYVESQYLYQDGDQYLFMNTSNYDQFGVNADVLGDQAKFLKDGLKVKAVMHNRSPISVELPIKLELEVTYTEPAVKGDTTSQVLKDAQLETGAHVQVPAFVKNGDLLRIDTRDGSYVERVR